MCFALLFRSIFRRERFSSSSLILFRRQFVIARGEFCEVILRGFATIFTKISPIYIIETFARAITNINYAFTNNISNANIHRAFFLSHRIIDSEYISIDK